MLFSSLMSDLAGGKSASHRMRACGPRGARSGKNSDAPGPIASGQLTSFGPRRSLSVEPDAFPFFAWRRVKGVKMRQAAVRCNDTPWGFAGCPTGADGAEP